MVFEFYVVFNVVCECWCFCVRGEVYEGGIDIRDFYKKKSAFCVSDPVMGTREASAIVGDIKEVVKYSAQ